MPLTVAVASAAAPGILQSSGRVAGATDAPMKAPTTAAKQRRNYTKDIDEIKVMPTGLIARDAEREELVSTLRASVAQSLLSSFQSIRQALEREGECSRGKDLQDCLLSAVLCLLRRCQPFHEAIRTRI